MYLTKLQITNVRSLRSLKLDFAPGGGWHVIVGENGAGKSTVIRALALAMLGDGDIEASNEDLSQWVRANSSRNEITIELASGRKTAASTIRLKRLANVVRAVREPPDQTIRNAFSASFGPYRRLTGSDEDLDKIYAQRPLLGAHLSALTEKVGIPEAERWLTALYSEEVQSERDLQRWLDTPDHLFQVFLDATGKLPPRKSKRAYSAKEEAAFLQVLGKEIARFEQDANRSMLYGEMRIAVSHAARLENDRGSLDLELTVHNLRYRLASFFNNSGFLFEQVKITEFRPDGVYVIDRAGARLSISQLSDGYRSVIGLGLEIIRLMHLAFGRDRLLKSLDHESGSVRLPGIVAIDEIEAHLHPTWQETVGTWLRRCFPLVQFIVTTHSPIVCRSVLSDRKLVGSVWKLPAPGSSAAAEKLEGVKLERLVYGNLGEAVSTEAFGRQVARSKGAFAMLDRLARLNTRAIHGDHLDESEREELEALRATFPVGTTGVNG